MFFLSIPFIWDAVCVSICFASSSALCVFIWVSCFLDAFVFLFILLTHVFLVMLFKWVPCFFHAFVISLYWDLKEVYDASQNLVVGIPIFLISEFSHIFNIPRVGIKNSNISKFLRDSKSFIRGDAGPCSQGTLGPVRGDAGPCSQGTLKPHW